jgi:hypothetical protein
VGIMAIEVTHTTIPALLKCLRDGEWLTPEFQRDFVWNTSAIISLINSIIDAKPIGMVTLWRQEDHSDLELEHISVPDGTLEGVRYFGDNNTRKGRFFAILDGKQRSTAIAIAFGGLRAGHGNYRHSGRYFLNVAADDPLDRVKHVPETQVQREGLDRLATAIGKGYFPLEVLDPDQVYHQWMDYTSKINQPEFYEGNILPSETELKRRYDLLKNAFDGMINTKLAVYVVPETENLGSICEVFETLNTTGTKVSTVDLIHSWLYADTKRRGKDPILLRDEIDSLGELEGANGWSSSKERPELVVQFAAASHVALDNKPEPRSVSGAKVTKIASIRGPDLLAVPDIFWERYFGTKEHVAKHLFDMQRAVAGGPFKMVQSPYPASVSIYLALRWYQMFDAPQGLPWNQDHLDNLFRAFFWRNAFDTRYDQGFLTKVGRDIVAMKEFLGNTDPKQSLADWRIGAEAWLDKLIPSRGLEDKIEEAVSDGGKAGALRSASRLLLYARATFDVVDPRIDISNVESTPDLHHIYPKDWCANNKTNDTKAYLDSGVGPDWMNSPANLMPMARSSNVKWKAQNPSMALGTLGIKTEQQFDLLNRYFIDKECLEYLRLGMSGMGKFLERRRSILATHLKRLLSV